MFSSCLNSQTTVGFTAIQVLNTPAYQKLVGSLIADCCQSYQGQISIEATLSDWNADCRAGDNAVLISANIFMQISRQID